MKTGHKPKYNKPQTTENSHTITNKILQNLKNYSLPS